MGKTSRQKPVQFPVGDTSKILQSCKNKLKPLLDKRELNFIPLQQDSQRHIFALIAKDSSNLITTDDRSNRHHIVPLLSTISGTYWLNISLTFLPMFSQSKQKTAPQSFQFSGVSIRVFKGLATENKKEPLLRAEWDILKDNNNHAQPHWHVYKSFQIRNLNATASDFESLIEADEVQDFGTCAEKFNSGERENDFQEDLGQNNTENEQASLKENDWDFETKFHFAMASQWHVNGGTHRIVIDQEALLYSWLAGCVQYIKEQLLYVSGGR
ncbi:hypothetical protein [Prochlorothrix hollandica]|uniref:Uncharacterized protein n=1 Tax=Prochlorothrix hollandica PCC 9006 = CALU 1027 TaxID=317619 RepID=A0A0M2PVP1_PROHO|nr:hypothetical protein [Prochlorothrix hollandica]KKI98431.1 hypothetical protein PROH_18410 [Prochlorothrix hollandica PCC 9006 = CALU 1027]